MIIVIVISTALFLCWFLLLFSANREDRVAAAKGMLLANRMEIDALRKKEDRNREKLSLYHGFSRRFMQLFLSTNESKEIDKLKKKNREIQEGNLRNIPRLDLPGYVILRKYPGICTSNFYRKIRSCYYELYGKKHQELLTRQLLAKMISYPVVGTAASLVLGLIIRFLWDEMIGLAVMIIGPLLVAVLAYSQYDDLSDLVIERKNNILRQYPNVLSKLALLVTSGMIMDRAWHETAFSNDGELYMEMRKTTEELSNLVAPEIAYSGFIDRCNTKETTKLASAILQNLAKGNSEIAILLQQMSKDAWNERRNLAKRDSENANSKLMIPTMLLFGAIIVMLLVPIAISLGNGL